MGFFRVRSASLWGDYGSILIHGMTAHLPRKDGLLQLERTGPFMPPLTLPGISDIVITDEFRQTLAGSPFQGLDYRPVHKARIVKYRWERWDRTSPEPLKYPDSGEPEDYILARRHSPEMADALGDVWEVILPTGGIIDTDSRQSKFRYDVRVHTATWDGRHLFRGRKASAVIGGMVIASDTGRKWLEEHVGEWIRFEQCLEK